MLLTVIKGISLHKEIKYVKRSLSSAQNICRVQLLFLHQYRLILYYTCIHVPEIFSVYYGNNFGSIIEFKLFIKIRLNEKV